MGKELRLIASENTKQSPKPKRVKLDRIEEEPRNDWFVHSTTRRGRPVVYLRFQVTGMSPRLYGPFPSKRQALLFLEETIIRLYTELAEADSECNDHRVADEFRHAWMPIVEHPILRQLAQQK